MRRVNETQSNWFDSWRGGSSLIVLVGHTIQFYGPSWMQNYAVAISQAAVMIFFAISGFFIHKSLAYSVQNNDTGRFVRSRFNRLVLPFLLCLSFTVILWLIAPLLFITESRDFPNPLGSRDSFSLNGIIPTTLLINAFFGQTVSANGALWSLSYEAWYYIGIFGVSLCLLRRISGVAIITVVLLLSTSSSGFIYLGLVWCSGALVSILHGNHKLPRVHIAYFIPIGLAISIALYMIIEYIDENYVILIWRILTGLSFAILMVFILNKKVVSYFSYASKSASFSYTLYVFHFPTLLFCLGVGVKIG